MKYVTFVLIGVLTFLIGIYLVGKPQEAKTLELKIPPQIERMIHPTKTIVVYDFWAVWCPPCRTFAPTFDAWKSKYSTSNITFKKVNIEEDQETAANFKISSIPTIIITVDGVETKRWTGAPKESDFVQFLK